MQFIVLQENLQQVFQDLQKSIPSRPSLPILSCFLIESITEGNQGVLKFSATDLNVGVSSTIDAQIITPGKLAVPAKVLMEYISTLSAGEVTFSLQGHELSLSSARSKATLPCLHAEDYPSFPEKEGQEIEMQANNFVPAIQSTSFTASVDEARPVLTASLFLFGDQLEIVSTDGFRLSTFCLPSPTVKDSEKTNSSSKLLIPAKALQEVVRIASRKKVESVRFTVSEKLKQVFFSFEHVEMMVRLLDGEFPPYQKIIPEDFSTQITFDGGEFAQQLKTAMIFARDSAGIIRFQISKDELKLISASSTLGTQESTLPIQRLTGSEDQEIAFNAKYLNDFLSTLKPERIWFGMNESLKPALFRPEGMDHFRYIVMPFRVNQ